MKKKIIWITTLILIIGLLVIGAVNRTLAKGEGDGEVQNGYGRGSRDISLIKQTGEMDSQGNGNGNGNGGNRYTQGVSDSGESEHSNLLPACSGDLCTDEAAALLYMREEEKLAHDVYVMFYTQFSLPIFQNISQSEQTHTDAIKALLDLYGLIDPASSQVGVFTNPDLQELYNQLIAQGSPLLSEALNVSAAIEEIDILDLQKFLVETDNTDIQQVFNNLMNGSTNHLRAFTSTLEKQTGETYQPQYLSPEAYQAIVTSSTDTVNSRGNEQGGNGGGRGRYGGRP